MSPASKVNNLAERYDRTLRHARDQELPPEVPRPHFTCEWPQENITLLERSGSGASAAAPAY